ncbi:alpha/beta hydrolase family protein [Kitasatospora purpeofusca]|uniref:alpha/beta hydrolase family protein n=1 Tax=Kitasatospora purpeofusca TaxID=67352 RepID=UPI0036D3F166
MARAPRRWLRRLLGAGLVLALLAGGAGGWVAYQNSYDLREERVVITGGAQPLEGVLARPEGGRGPYGLVVFVHGDSEQDATHDTFYRPIWESLARAGYASLSWNKPGVGGAPGNWLDQSMEDRAAETAAAIAWAKGRPGVDPERIGLWGASQAGWVLPKVANRVPGVRFVIAVGTAVNWLQQGRYDLLTDLEDEHAPQDRVDAALARRERVEVQLRKGATYQQARAALGADLDGIGADRWGFIQRNFTSDATADLSALTVPVLLALGERDRNVDIDDTEAGYRRLLARPGQLTVHRYPGATHGIAHSWAEDGSLRGLLVAVAAPRSVYADGYLGDLRRFAATVAPVPGWH